MATIFRTLSMTALLSILLISFQFRSDPTSAALILAKANIDVSSVNTDPNLARLANTLTSLTEGIKATQPSQVPQARFFMMRIRFWINRNETLILKAVFASLICAVLFNIWLENRRPKRR